ncbi:general stress protein CsbD [Flavobacterium sp.]|uniref:general stress protein CsbD n=1 Tax=Flavobacterium sp. TaxID=239 RepID=UPI0037539E0E
MDTTNINGSWEELKSKLKQKFTDLNDDDLQLEDSKKEEIIEKIQLQVGKTKEELYKIIRGF